MPTDQSIDVTGELRWVEDVLGPPYVATTIDLPADEEGEVVATLVHRPADRPNGRAVLHVHGFCDYFFQTVAAEHWTDRGYDFYALDLRKHGRSLRPHQTPNYVADLAEYYPELDRAWQIAGDGHDGVLLSAHSTGGLTVPLWVQDRDITPAGIVLNSPWLAMHGDALARHVGMPIVDRIASLRPMFVVPREVSGIYGRLLHRRYAGEWDFDLEWKPLSSFAAHAGWLRAIRRGHARIAAGLDTSAPVLVLLSAASGHPHGDDDPVATTTDIVLNVDSLRRAAPMLGSHVTIARIQGAIHDVTLSAEPVRRRVFAEIDRFCAAYL